MEKETVETNSVCKCVWFHEGFFILKIKNK